METKKGWKRSEKGKGHRSLDEDSISYKNIAMNRMLSKAENELLRLKAKVAPVKKSLGSVNKYNQEKKKDIDYSLYGGYNATQGSVEEWSKAYDKFCQKSCNIYGLKVDRKHLIPFNKDFKPTN